ncbi:iron-sulfur cluster insertion protein ErpA [Escherichia coli]|uniref:Iron-sulfur cluster insertion protein ErpA n=1 Tax=Escherichia coli TaxID=562 RepID=A0A376LIZ4_ECOLX|nr:iron-sulfur cluster insertion protein ErpA [Escherichia coli]
MSDDVALPLEFTDAAANKVKSLIADEDNPKSEITRVYHRWRLQRLPVWFHL